MSLTNGAIIADRVPLLARMTDDMEHHGALRLSTAAAMWAAYTAHTTLTAWALTRQVAPLPIARALARVAGTAMVAAGGGLCVAGMTRFTGIDELTGTSNQALLTSGIYRYSRNPQYLGYLVALAGTGVARRSCAALGSTAALAAVYAAWIPVEERHLTELYGEPYTDYTRRTRRWWGRNG